MVASRPLLSNASNIDNLLASSGLGENMPIVGDAMGVGLYMPCVEDDLVSATIGNGSEVISDSYSGQSGNSSRHR